MVCQIILGPKLYFGIEVSNTPDHIVYVNIFKEVHYV